MMKTKVYLLLDIDGVLSPLGPTTPDALIHNNGWATFAVPFDVIEFLHHVAPLVTFVSSSSWAQDGASLFRNMFITVEEYLDFSQDSSGWQKAAALEKWIESHSGSQIIILDDEFSPAFLQAVSSHDFVTCVQVEGREGLDIATMNMIESLVGSFHAND